MDWFQTKATRKEPVAALSVERLDADFPPVTCMQHSILDELAERTGIAPGYTGADGSWVETPAATKRRLLEALGISSGDELASRGDPRHDRAARCYLPRWLLESPAWGITGQLYELRSKRSWGIGDFADLEMLCTIAARQGADFVGLTPLHAPFLADPERCSPFSPSNRRFLNPIHIAVDGVEGYDAGAHLPDGLDQAETVRLVDYSLVARTKLAALRDIWDVWRAGGRSDPPISDFASFRAKADPHLVRHALFEAISARMVCEGRGAGWRDWPEEFRNPESGRVKAFAEEAADDVDFHLWLQFLAERQLSAAARVAREGGMRIGLYLDLAVGDEPDGSATWSAPERYLAGVTIGAPPDYFSTQGQDWGIAALSPLALERQNYAPFEELIADATRHAGALRIDHVMALRQLFLVPEAATAAEGAHLSYPIAELVRRLARLSHDRRLLVIGEDLGHVPEGFREVMRDAAILSYRILYFEQTKRGFRRARDYPHRSIACLSTHDLPTFRGWWRGHDVELRLEHGLIDDEGAERQRANRAGERRALTRIVSGGRRPPPEWRVALDRPQEAPPDSLTAAVHGFLASSRALLAGVRIADLVGEDEPTNLPGTSGTYPNWRLRMPVLLEELEDVALFREITGRLTAVRGRR